MVDTLVEIALGYVQIEPQRDANHLTTCCSWNSIVWSDEWAAYNHVASLSNVSNHDVVNHSVECWIFAALTTDSLTVD